MAERTCSLPGCGDLHRAKGYCNRHYKAWQRYGDPLATTPLSLEARFWTQVNKRGPIQPHCPELGPCSEWTGSKGDGYGIISDKGVWVRAHRLAWTLAHGPIPDGLCVLHRCDNPPCVKALPDAAGPAHLFLGTLADNTYDMLAKGRYRRVPAVGERVNTARLTAEQVRELRRLWAAGESFASLARRYGVGESTAAYAAKRKSWKHLA